MVQGLAFLSKKSWHVKNIANQERVWIEEQKKAAEDTKTQELAKQIQREREDEELDRISGKKSNRLDRGIDWMYQGVTSEAAQEDAKKSAEEYLMGKQFTGDSASALPQGDLVQAENEKEGVNAVLSSVAEPESAAGRSSSIMAGPSVADRNEAFRVRHEDPMFLVSQKRREQEVKVEKKKALYEKVVGTIHHDNDDDEDSYRRRKREKKDHKKAKKRRKEEHRRRRDRSRSRDQSVSEDESRNSSKYRRRRSESPVDNSRRSRYGEKSAADGGEDRRSRGAEKRDHHDRHARSYRDNSPRRKDDRQHDESHRREDSRRHDRDQGRKDSGRKNEASRCEAHEGQYGLQGKSKPLGLEDLGPSKELLHQRRREQERERVRRNAAPRRRMTAEERNHALRDMQSDARQYNSNRVAARPVEEEEERKSAAFLHKMAQETHGVRGDHRSMADRVAQNRHTNQKSHDSFF